MDTKRLIIAERILICVILSLALASLGMIVIAIMEPRNDIHMGPLASRLTDIVIYIFIFFFGPFLPLSAFFSAKRVAAMTEGRTWFKRIQLCALVCCSLVIIGAVCSEWGLISFALGFFYFGVVSLLTMSRQADALSPIDGVKGGKLRTVARVVCAIDIVGMILMPAAFVFDVEEVLYSIVGPLSVLAVILNVLRVYAVAPSHSWLRKVTLCSVILFVVAVIGVAVVEYRPGIILSCNLRDILALECDMCYCYAVIDALVMTYLFNNRIHAHSTDDSDGVGVSGNRRES